MSDHLKLKTPLPGGPALPVRNFDWDVSASAWVAKSNDINFAADIEIDGSPLLIRTFNISATGTNTITAVTSGLKIYKAFMNFESDVTGHVFMALGGNEIGRIRNPLTGGNHVMASAVPDYEYLTATGTLIVSLPTATSVVAATVTLHYGLP